MVDALIVFVARPRFGVVSYASFIYLSIYIMTGRRPTGKGLFSWLYHFIVDGVGVVGFDPILGALSPPLRLLIHVSACCMLSAVSSWLFLLLAFSNKNDTVCATFTLSFLSFKDDDDDATKATFVSLLPVFAVTTLFYTAYFYYLMYMLPGVSVPGGPRPHKIQRQPSWPNKDISIPDELLLVDGWRCASAEDSHLVTAEVMEGNLLTGESFGRDLWTREPRMNYPRRGKKVTRSTETLIQEMASGGRTPGKFNPSVNPNRCVCVCVCVCVHGFCELMGFVVFRYV